MGAERRLTTVLGITQLLAWATTYYVPAVFTVAVARDLHAGTTAVIGAFSLALLVTGLCSPAVGRRIQRCGGRGLLAAGHALQAAGLLLLGAAGSLPGWYAGWAVLGIGMAFGLYDATFATLGRLLGEAARPSIVGVTLIAGFAGSIGWPAGVWLVGHFGWRIAAFVFAAVQLVVALPLVLVFVPTVQAVAVRARAVARAGRPRGFVPLAGFFTLRQVVSAVVSVYALILLGGLGLSQGAAVATAAMFGPCQVAGRLAEFALGRRVDPLTTSRLGAVLLPVSLALLLTLSPLWVAAPCFALLYGVSNGVLTISRGTLPLHLYGAGNYPALVGRLALPQMVAQALAPAIVAPLVARWPAGWLFALCGGLGAAAFALLALVRR